MAIFKCKICGGSLDIADGSTVAVCEYCGTKQTVPTTKDEVVANLFNRANNLRLKCEFDKAEQVYEKILDIDNADVDAHWGLVLCKYGIEYVDDSKTNTKIPTCHRTLYDAVLTDIDYIAAIENSDAEQKELYEAEAKIIDELQKNILNIVNNEEPFDVFICYKETDDDGKRTVDSSISNDIYYQLTQEGFKVFYAPITLEDKLGYEYEPYIFAALNSAKVMLVVGTKPEYFDSVWVRNEWSRYLKLMKAERSKLLIPCYKDMDAYELPDEFAHLQAQDMGKIGFISDVIRGLRKVIYNDEQIHTSSNKKKMVKTSKFRRMIDDSKRKRQEKKKYCLTFPNNIFAKFYYIISLILNGYFSYEIIMLNTDLELWTSYLAVQTLTFLMPTLILLKKCYNKALPILIHGISTALCLLFSIGFGDLPYIIEEGLYALTLLITVLNIPLFILMCLTKRIEKQKIVKPEKRRTIISAMLLSLVLVFVFSSISIKFFDYQLAKTFYKVGAYDYANEYFIYLADYKDSLEQAQKAKLSEIKNTEYLNRVRLGHWVDGNVVYDGKSYDGWYVIAKEDNKVLLLSDDGHIFSGERPNIKGGWTNSSIRRFLNSEFYEKAFPKYIKERIVTTNLTNSHGTTTDKIFILSQEEIEKYVPFISDRTEVTQYFRASVYLRDFYNNKHGVMLDSGQFTSIEYENETERTTKTKGFNIATTKYVYQPAMWVDISGIEN